MSADGGSHGRGVWTHAQFPTVPLKHFWHTGLGKGSSDQPQRTDCIRKQTHSTTKGSLLGNEPKIHDDRMVAREASREARFSTLTSHA